MGLYDEVDGEFRKWVGVGMGKGILGSGVRRGWWVW